MSDNINVLNEFAVSSQADFIRVILPPVIPISRDRALVLAAWIVALADRDGKFVEILKAVQGK